MLFLNNESYIFLKSQLPSFYGTYKIYIFALEKMKDQFISYKAFKLELP